MAVAGGLDVEPGELQIIAIHLPRVVVVLYEEDGRPFLGRDARGELGLEFGGFDTASSGRLRSGKYINRFGRREPSSHGRMSGFCQAW